MQLVGREIVTKQSKCIISVLKNPKSSLHSVISTYTYNTQYIDKLNNVIEESEKQTGWFTALYTDKWHCLTAN